MEKCVNFLVNNQKIFGMLHLPESNRRVPGVAFCHGFTGNRIEVHRLFVKMARQLAANGIAALRFDFRGSGESEGDFEQITISDEITDALAALDFLRRQSEIESERIGIIGLSLGGCVAACAAARDGRVKALALWAAVADPNILKPGDSTLLGLLAKEGWIDVGGWRVSRNFYEDARTIHPLQEVSKYNGSVLIIHGSRDSVVPVEHAYWYYNAFQGPKELYILPEADHTFNKVTWEEEVLRITLSWFKNNL